MQRKHTQSGVTDLGAEEALHLLEVVQDMALARDLQAVTDLVKRTARRMTGADGVTFVLKDGEQCWYVDEDAISPLWKGRRFPVDACISGWAMTHAETVVIEDIYADDRIPHDAYRPTFVQSLAMIPVRSADPVAAIGAYWADKHRATRREVDLLQTLADTAAVAIENMQLIETLEHRAEESARLLKKFKEEVRKREEAEEQAMRSQRMEAVGRLAGGIAHDFNNLVTVISGYVTMALEDECDERELHTYLSEIGRAADSATSLTRQLLAFSRKQVLKPVVLDLNDVLGEIEQMVRRLIGENIDMVTDLQPDLDPVKVDRGQLQQIILNLAVNARDAMPEGGQLTIETADVHLDEEYAITHGDASPGPHVMLAVSDTGIGMDRETRDRIFEPFFTTKERGKGTGLGLSTAYGIVKQSGGNIWVYSEPGIGTTFKVYLPRAEEAIAPERAAAPEPERGLGHETILLVEDDDSVRGLLRRILEADGYTVLTAADEQEAIRRCEEHDGDLHMLLTDVVLPDMGGPRLAERITELRPDVKVVFISGYTDTAIARGGVLDEDTAYIEKPVSPAVLRRRIREYLS